MSLQLRASLPSCCLHTRGLTGLFRSDPEEENEEGLRRDLPTILWTSRHRDVRYLGSLGIWHHGYVWDEYGGSIEEMHKTIEESIGIEDARVDRSGAERRAWAQSMDVCDQTHSEGILLRTTVMTQQSEIVELRAADQRRQTVISELLKTDYRRQRQLVETLKIVKSLKAQMIEIQRQQGPAKDPAEPELPEEAGSNT
ncbi:hypothetical protein Tco_0672089 [Tanacetum coccineum]